MKKTIAVVCGGKSGEHEVSLRSAFYVYNNLDKKKYQVVILAIDKKGNWFFGRNFNDLVNTKGLLWKLKPRLEEVVLLKSKNGSQVLSLKKKRILTKINIFFPLIHGTYGEDGCLQGFLELLNVPYVGADVIGSAIGMDKEITKKLLIIEKIPITKFVVIKKVDSLKEKQEKIKIAIKQFHFPLFIKPVSLGSSVGVFKVLSEKEIKKAIEEALQYDFVKSILEYQCEINQKSVDFYSYKAKYLDENEAKLLVPAPLNKKLITQIQKLSIQTFKALELKGMARVDFFLKPNNQLIVNEVNTIPGFTQISMYPKLWEVSGIKYSKLLDSLVQLAIESHNEKNKLKFSYN